MFYKALLSKGATITTPLTYHKDRPKVSGYMYGGKATLTLNGINYYFEMWHHGGDEMTPEEAQEAISLRGIEKDGKYYDTYWYTLMSPTEIWLHPKGWFDNLDTTLKAAVEKIRHANYNFARDNGFNPDQLIALGFERIL